MRYALKRFSREKGEYIEFIDEKGRVIDKKGKVKSSQKKYSIVMTESDLQLFSDYLEEKTFGLMTPIKNVWNSGAWGKTKVIGGTALALGTTGALLGNHIVNNDND